MNKKHKDIYLAIIAYCEKHGLIKKLETSLKRPESKRFDDLNLESNGLDLLDVIHCLLDEKKIKYFSRDIDIFVNNDSMVLEAGIGTGVLSFFAAANGANVLGLEINSKVYTLAIELLAYLVTENILLPNKIKFLNMDATKFKTKEKFDVIISENIYTAMFYEKQVQILNNLLNYKKDGGEIIPAGMSTKIILLDYKQNKSKELTDLFVPSETNCPLKDFKELSGGGICISDLDFYKKNSTTLEFEQLISIKRNAELKGVLFYSEIKMPSGRIIRRNACEFLNEDVVLPLKNAFEVKALSSVQLKLVYNYSDKPANVRLNAWPHLDLEETKSRFQNEFKAQDYLQTYYREPDFELIKKYVVKNDVSSETMRIMIFLESVGRTAIRMAFGDKKPNVLELGGGPTLYQLMNIIDDVQEIHFTDFVQDNLNQIISWKNNNERFFRWGKFLKASLMIKNDRINISQEEINKLENDLRKKINKVSSCDVFKNNLGLGQKKYDIISTHFVAESATSSKSEWKKAIRNIYEKINPGGLLLMSALRGANGCYRVLEKRFPAVCIDENDMEIVLKSVGFRIIRLSTINTEDRSNEYKGFILLVAQKF